MNTERDDREQIEAIRKMMAEKEEKKVLETHTFALENGSMVDGSLHCIQPERNGWPAPAV